MSGIQETKENIIALSIMLACVSCFAIGFVIGTFVLPIAKTTVKLEPTIEYIILDNKLDSLYVYDFTNKALYE